MSVKDLNKERVRREEDNTKISVKELLEYASDCIDELPEDKKPDGCAIVAIRRDPETGHIVYLTPFRCGLNRVEEIGVLALHEHLTIQDSLIE